MCLLRFLGPHERRNVSQISKYVGFKMSRLVILLDAQASEGRFERSCGACRREAWCQNEFRVGGAQTQVKSFLKSWTYNNIDRNIARRGRYLLPHVWADRISLLTWCGSSTDTWQFLMVNYEVMSACKKWDINYFHGFTPFQPFFHSFFLDNSLYYTKAKILQFWNTILTHVIFPQISQRPTKAPQKSISFIKCRLAFFLNPF